MAYIFSFIWFHLIPAYIHIFIILWQQLTFRRICIYYVTFIMRHVLLLFTKMISKMRVWWKHVNCVPFHRLYYFKGIWSKRVIASSHAITLGVMAPFTFLHEQGHVKRVQSAWVCVETGHLFMLLQMLQDRVSHYMATLYYLWSAFGIWKMVRKETHVLSVNSRVAWAKDASIVLSYMWGN